MRAVLRLLLPLRCLGCGGHVPDAPGSDATDPLCLGCRLRLHPPPAPRCPRGDLPRGTGPDRPRLCGRCDDWPGILGAARTGAVLEPPADALVQGLKYGGWARSAPAMARVMARRWAPEWSDGTPLLVPVPTTPGRRRRRGYNQARLLAEALGRIRGVPLADALVRRESRDSQVALPVDRRRANVSGAFGPGPEAGRVAAHSHTILVDDVLTTGATACEAALALGELGAPRVSLLAFARALPRPVAVPVG